MDTAVNEDPGTWYKVRHVRTIIVAVTVSFPVVAQYLNEISFNGITHDITDVWHTNDDWPHHRSWNQVRRTTQISHVVVGILASALFAYLFERHRRKTCLYLVCICQITTSILLLCTNSYWLLHVTRATSALGDIGAGMFCVIYISEIAPDEIRGALVGIHKLLYAVTKFIPEFIYLSHIPLKSLPFACVSIVISILVALCSYAGVPESPIYFLRRENMAGAEDSLKFLLKNETIVSQVLSKKNDIVKTTRSDFQNSRSIFQECIRRRTLTFSCIAFALYFMRITARSWMKGQGIEAIVWGVPKYKLAVSSLHQVILDISILCCILLVIALCDRLGRKKLVLLSAFLSSISSVVSRILLIVYQYYIDDRAIRGQLSNVYILFNVVHSISFNLGLSILPEVLISDFFPPKILNTQVAVFSTFQLCVDYILHYEINCWENVVAQYWVLWGFEILSFLLTCFIAKFLPETNCRPAGFMFIETEEERVLYSELQDDID